MEFIKEIENQLGIEVEKNLRPMQPGDVRDTWVDVEDLFEYISYPPPVGIKKGIEEFIHWYKEF